MTHAFLAPLLALLLLAAPARAADPVPDAAAPAAWSSMKRWLETMKKGLMSSSVERNYQKRRGVVAVAAVRGSGQGMDDVSKPYWKGTAASREERQNRRERRELEGAVDLALSGKRDEALKALDDFETAHPDSSLLASAREARERLKAADKETSEPAAHAAATVQAEPAAKMEAPKPDVPPIAGFGGGGSKPEGSAPMTDTSSPAGN